VKAVDWLENWLTPENLKSVGNGRGKAGSNPPEMAKMGTLEIQC
jgi:hypothetical protein